ncbi:MAG: hypothetical protein EBS05_18110 [Proteobacteria bacterium]|nr:hypothetical protein [Pseudomonadota bacterium]
MKKSLIKTLLASSIAAILCLGSTPSATAADKEKEKEKTEEKGKKGGSGFTGKAVAVDKAAKTVKLSGKTARVIQITDTTKINKDGKPATLDDLKEGDEVSGGFKTTADGKLEATVLNIGPKPAVKGKDEKK